MTLSELYEPPAELAEHAHIKSRDQYDEMYRQSLADPDRFWSEQAEAFHWNQKWQFPVLEYVLWRTVALGRRRTARTLFAWQCWITILLGMG